MKRAERFTFLPVGSRSLILALLAVIFATLAHCLLVRLERRARQEGHLTVRWL